ncbi:MAG: DEAD/DEAH box helicase family protein [Chloroflexota bacterium]
MEFRFDANQAFQTEAVDAVADLLDGQPLVTPDLTLALGGGFAAVGNRLDLSEGTILNNLRNFQERKGIEVDKTLNTIDQDIETADGRKLVSFPNFSVEMETGTGKTYVYIRTVLELFSRYGLRKFIVAVPSVAVREGVLKTLRMTQQHFRELYTNVPYRYYAYNSENLTQIRSFALSDSIEIMIMTLDSFNKAGNVFWRSTDHLQGETPVHLVQAARPILTLDEPQNMESEKSIAALAALDPLFALRYSATHRNAYNLVYRLTPFDAYRQGLVKRIEVASVVKDDDFNQVFLRLEDIKAQKKTVSARLAVHQLMKDGSVKEKVVTVKPGDSLEDKTKRPEYASFVVDEINPGSESVCFANGIEIGLGESQGADKEAVFEAQIRYSIEEHFRKQARLKPHGIKVLSLFFIDRVANYASEDGIIRRLFDAQFESIRQRYPDWSDIDSASVQAAYFAQRRSTGGEVIYEDSTTGAAKKDEEAYDLIMKDKERLLSFDQPVSFIFSHSALREGWDNPNVFQICTLNQTTSEMKKRQEVGRGMRLAVDQTGERVWDEHVNILTVVANESYDRYVSTLQQEIEADHGKSGLPPRPKDARKRGIARLRKEYTLRPEFQELWQRISPKTRYAVRVDTETLIQQVVGDLDKVQIRPPQVVVSKARVAVDDEDRLHSIRLTGDKGVLDLSKRHTLPNVIGIMTHLLEFTTPPIRLSRCTLLEIFRRTSNQQAALSNPQEFAAVVVQILKSRLADQLADGIQYEKINQWYEMTQFDAEIESWEDHLVPADHALYDYVIYDSAVERQFVEDLEGRDDVRLYIKLPNWFKVPTPVGEYNPDWAIVMEDRDEHADTNGKPLLYLVRETKSTTNMDDLRPDERRKIICGGRFFREALGVEYTVGPEAATLP